MITSITNLINGFASSNCTSDQISNTHHPLIQGYCTDLPQATASSSQLHDLLQIIFAIIGALSVLFIVLAGLRFVTAQGNPQEYAKARSTIIYAIVGLLIAITAEAIVTFAIGKL